MTCKEVIVNCKEIVMEVGEAPKKELQDCLEMFSQMADHPLPLL